MILYYLLLIEVILRHVSKSYILDCLNITMSSQENIETVRRAMEAFNTGDMNKVHEFVSSEYINRVAEG